MLLAVLLLETFASPLAPHRGRASLAWFHMRHSFKLLKCCPHFSTEATQPQKITRCLASSAVARRATL